RGGDGDGGADGDRGRERRVPRGGGAGGRVAGGVSLRAGQRAAGRVGVGPDGARGCRHARGVTYEEGRHGMSRAGAWATLGVLLLSSLAGCSDDSPIGRQVGVWGQDYDAILASEVAQIPTGDKQRPILGL